MKKYNLSLDNALNKTGYTVFLENSVIEFGIIDASKEFSTGRKILYLYQALQQIFEKYQLENIYFEDCQFQNNQKTYKSLSLVQGIIILFCEQHDMSYKILAPSHWRSILKDKFHLSFGRKRAEQKQVAQEFVQNKFNITVTEDEADSICLGLAAILEKGYTESNDECAF